MKLILLLILLLCIAVPASAQCQTIYRWTDESGVHHFSDVPPQHARFQTLQIADPPVRSAAATAVTAAEAENTASSALSIQFEQPRHDATLRDNTGYMLVVANLSRPLNKDEQLQLLLDGQPYRQPDTASQWQITNLDRGSHSLTIQLLINGKVIASTSTIMVHMHRASIR
ncbi:DUF4124 domain-containing protein [Vibrio sp.]|uniref:DUF4124 domain-containing protein n=1 Tax=Vibrio sp. TaxID=678 RepID=UPI003D139EB4